VRDGKACLFLVDLMEAFIGLTLQGFVAMATIILYVTYLQLDGDNNIMRIM